MRRFWTMLLALAATPAWAAEPQANCAGQEYRQLDFWLGDWNAAWDGSPGTPAGRGSNHITKSYENCVIEERFDGRPGQHLMGHSVSIYFAPTKQWRQTWVDNEGGYIDLTGGPQPNGDFVLATPRRPSGRFSRMVFTDIRKDSFTWRWQSSTDGKAWADSWVIRYTRRKTA